MCWAGKFYSISVNIFNFLTRLFLVNLQKRQKIIIHFYNDLYIPKKIH